MRFDGVSAPYRRNLVGGILLGPDTLMRGKLGRVVFGRVGVSAPYRRNSVGGILLQCCMARSGAMLRGKVWRG